MKEEKAARAAEVQIRINKLLVIAERFRNETTEKFTFSVFLKTVMDKHAAENAEREKEREAEEARKKKEEYDRLPTAEKERRRKEAAEKRERILKERLDKLAEDHPEDAPTELDLNKLKEEVVRPPSSRFYRKEKDGPALKSISPKSPP